jgi:hypothetical protein
LKRHCSHSRGTDLLELVAKFFSGFFLKILDGRHRSGDAVALARLDRFRRNLAGEGLLMRKPIAFFLLAALAVPTTQLMAVIIPPIGLAPGSQYQLVFATKGIHDAISPDIGVYNAFVTAQALLNPLLPPATWHAVASTDSIAANVNAPSSGLPVFNTQGGEVSSAFSKFYFSPHVSAIQFDQFGVQAPPREVWTGSSPNGFEVWGLGNASQPIVTEGNPAVATFGWAETTQDPPSTQLGFYALSSPITLPVPEPASLTLLGSALLAIGGIRCIRWRHRA